MRPSGRGQVSTPGGPTYRSPPGERLGARTNELLAGRIFSLVLTSPLQRATRTAQLAGLTGADTDDNLMEWDYGEEVSWNRALR